MKSKALLFAVTAILFLTSNQTIAQVQVWQQTYTVLGSNLWAHGLVTHSSGIYSCAEERIPGSGIVKLRIVKHNYSGGLLNSNVFPFGAAINGCEIKQTLCDAAGNLYIMVYVYRTSAATNYSDCYVFSYSPTLTFRWINILNFGDKDEEGEMLITPTGTLFAAITFNNSSVYRSDLGVRRINTSTGATIYSATYSTGNYFYPIDIVVDGSGNAYVCGSSYDRTVGYIDGVLVKFNSSGVVNWASYYTSALEVNFKDLTLDNFGNTVYVCGSINNNLSPRNEDAIVLKYNTSGALTASYTQSTVDREIFFKVVYEVAGGVTVYGSRNASSGASNLSVVKLSSTLSTVSSTNNYSIPVGLPPYFTGINILENPNGTKIITLHLIEQSSGGNVPYTFLIKTTATGYVIYSRYESPYIHVQSVALPSHNNTDYITMEGNNNIIIRRFTGPAARYSDDSEQNNELEVSKLAVYPNPASTDINIVGSTNVDELLLFDMQGKQLSIVATSSSENSIKLNVSDLPSGVYFIRNKNNTTTPTRIVVTH